MDFDKLKLKLRAFIIGVFALFIVVVLVRIFFNVIGANPDAGIVNFWYKFVSVPFIMPFEGIYPDFKFGTISIESSAILSIIVMFALMFLVIKTVFIYVEDDPRKLLTNFIDTLFKYAEFILIFRFFLKITGAKVIGFSSFIYYFSGFVYEPFKGILPSIKFGSYDQYVIEISTIIAIIFIIVFDIVTEGIIKSLFEGDKKKDKEEEPKLSSPFTDLPQPQPQQQQPQTNITINVPEQAPKPYQEPAQTININQQPAQFPQYPQNQLNQPGELNQAGSYDPNAGPNNRQA
jgi:hypothetical protein